MRKHCLHYHDVLYITPPLSSGIRCGNFECARQSHIQPQGRELRQHDAPAVSAHGTQPQRSELRQHDAPTVSAAAASGSAGVHLAVKTRQRHLRSICGSYTAEWRPTMRYGCTSTAPCTRCEFMRVEDFYQRPQDTTQTQHADLPVVGGRTFSSGGRLPTTSYHTITAPSATGG